MDQVARVREKIDIVAFISEYLPLKKTGRNFTTLCPFHSEKTPSFVISPERQIWHCFGCNKGGDCFSFLMGYENLEFSEALRILAKRVGVVLESLRFDGGQAAEKEKIYTLNRVASEFYHFVLTKHNAGKKALNYLLKKRGINEKILKTFMLGFAPSQGDALVKYLTQKKKYSKEEISRAGLSVFKNNSTADFFVNRIIFPLTDHRGNILGFSARIIDDLLQVSKYINTRETLVYHKGSVFFGLDLAKDSIKKENQAIIMEGEFDVIVSFQEGIKNAIAVKGTALTENQVNLLSRFAQNVGLCFDTDSAGQEALKRSVGILEKMGMTTSVIVVSNSKDPDEAVKKDPISFKKAIKAPVGVYDFLFAKSFSLFDKKSAEGKKKIGDDLLPFLLGIENEIVKEHYLKKLAGELDVSYESILRQLEKNKSKKNEWDEIKNVSQKKKRDEMLEAYLLSLILQHKDIKSFLEKNPGLPASSIFKTPVFVRIAEHLLSYLKEVEEFKIKQFLTKLPLELTSAFDSCYLFPLPNFSNEEYVLEIEKVAKELKILTLRSSIKEISQKIKKEEQENEKSQELEVLQKQLARLTSLLGSTTFEVGGKTTFDVVK